MDSQVLELEKQALKEFESSKDLPSLEKVRVNYIGKKGKISLLLKELGGLKDISQKKHLGSILNKVKNKLDQKYTDKKNYLLNLNLSKELNEPVSFDLRGVFTPSLGSLHPIEIIMNEMIDIFSRLGFYTRLGPMIESEEYNFKALNIPKDHPARDMQDTFYIDENYSLRPHTSPIQIRTMRKDDPPISVLGPGSVFRCDDDISHSPMFHQLEGLLIDKNISMSDLKGILSFFAKEFFGDVEIRFRPSYFPFTEPSAEVDCTCILCNRHGCSMCSYSGWLEIAGSGLVHPNVLKMSGIDPERWQGLAFGLGVERMSIIKYKVSDIRLFFENDLRFLRQF